MTGQLPALVAPFVADRYRDARSLSTLICPPYDVITADDWDEYASRNRHNVVRLILPEGDPTTRYEHAARALADWRERGVLARDEGPSVYVVQQEFTTPDGKSHLRTGVIAGLHVEPYSTGRVKPHERTHAGPKEDRLALSRATNAMLESIFVLARDERGRLQRRLHAVTRHEPTATATLGETRIGLWHVAGSQGVEVARAASGASVYIADGHHRYETANAYRAENPAATRIPAMIVPIRDPGLVVLPTHRLIGGRPFDRDAVLARIGHGAVMTSINGNADEALSALDAGRTGAVLVCANQAPILVSLGADPDTPDIAVVEDRLVTPLREAARGAVSYSASQADALEAVERGTAVAAVLVNPTPVEVVLAVADAGGVMPPKSTYFKPKVPSGLVVMGY